MSSNTKIALEIQVTRKCFSCYYPGRGILHFKPLAIGRRLDGERIVVLGGKFYAAIVKKKIKMLI